MAAVPTAHSLCSNANSPEIGEIQIVDMTAHEVLQRRGRGTQSRVNCDGIAAAFESRD